MMKTWYKIYYYDVASYTNMLKPNSCILEQPMPVYPIAETAKFLIFEGTGKYTYKSAKTSPKVGFFPTLKQAIKAKRLDLRSKIKALQENVINTKLLLNIFNHTYKGY